MQSRPAKLSSTAEIYQELLADDMLKSEMGRKAIASSQDRYNNANLGAIQARTAAQMTPSSPIANPQAGQDEPNNAIHFRR